MVDVNNAKSESVTSALSLYNNKNVIRRNANFIINNPNNINISGVAPEMHTLCWNCYNNICAPTDYVIIIT